MRLLTLRLLQACIHHSRSRRLRCKSRVSCICVEQHIARAVIALHRKTMKRILATRLSVLAGAVYVYNLEVIVNGTTCFVNIASYAGKENKHRLWSFPNGQRLWHHRCQFRRGFAGLCRAWYSWECRSANNCSQKNVEKPWTSNSLHDVARDSAVGCSRLPVGNTLRLPFERPRTHTFQANISSYALGDRCLPLRWSSLIVRKPETWYKTFGSLSPPTGGISADRSMFNIVHATFTYNSADVGGKTQQKNVLKGSCKERGVEGAGPQLPKPIESKVVKLYIIALQSNESHWRYRRDVRASA